MLWLDPTLAVVVLQTPTHMCVHERMASLSVDPSFIHPLALPNGVFATMHFTVTLKAPKESRDDGCQGRRPTGMGGRHQGRVG
jgi:hypothetical protein